jgi:hypothetical protein
MKERLNFKLKQVKCYVFVSSRCIIYCLYMLRHWYLAVVTCPRSVLKKILWSFSLFFAGKKKLSVFAVRITA